MEIPRSLTVLALLIFAGVGASAAEVDKQQKSEKFSLSAGLSTAGVSLEAAYRFNSKWAVRGLLGGAFTVFGDGEVAGVDYDWRVRLGGAALFADYYPFEDGLRLSGGVVVPDAFIVGSARGDLTVGDTEYSGARLEGRVRPRNDILPIVSLGYVQPLNKKLSLTGDIGVIFTEGFVANFDSVGGTEIDADDIAQESAEFRDQAWEFFPFLSIALSYRF